MNQNTKSDEQKEEIADLKKEIKYAEKRIAILLEGKTEGYKELFNRLPTAIPYLQEKDARIAELERDMEANILKWKPDLVKREVALEFLKTHGIYPRRESHFAHTKNDGYREVAACELYAGVVLDVVVALQDEIQKLQDLIREARNHVQKSLDLIFESDLRFPVIIEKKASYVKWLKQTEYLVKS